MRSSSALTAAAALLLVSLAAADMLTTPYEERSEEETRRMFVEWMAKHRKTYKSIGEEEFRYAVSQKVLRFIDQHSAAADAGIFTHRLGLNQFADFTDEDWRARPNWSGYLPPDSDRGRKKGPVAEDLCGRKWWVTTDQEDFTKWISSYGGLVERGTGVPAKQSS